MLPTELINLLKENNIEIPFAERMVQGEELMYSELKDLEYMQDRIDTWKEMFL